MNQTQNKTALKSKEWITTSLLQLMQTKNFQEITITELTKAADLSRKTFYRLFESKEDVLCAYIQKIWHDYVYELYTKYSHSFAETLLWYLNLCYQNRDFLLLLYKNNLFALLHQEFNNLFKEAYLVKKADYPLAKEQDGLRYVLSYVIGGTLNILWQWAADGMNKKPDDIYHLVMLAFQTPDL